MRKISRIAVREFVTTVMTRGFIIGLLIVPVMITVAVIAGPRLINQRSFRAQGQIALVDSTGLVAPELRAAVDPQALAARREEDTRRAMALIPDTAQAAARGPGQTAVAVALGQIPDLHVVDRPPAADIQRQKEWLQDEAAGADRHLALVVIHPDAVTRTSESAPYGTYDLYVPANVDDRIDTVLQQTLRQALVAARAKAANMDRTRMDEVMRVDRVTSLTVTRAGERKSVRGLNIILPTAFIVLMFMGVMMGGQTLMTSTIEEKSSRVVEVLLSAVSPLELMAGKIIGQMAVSVIALGIYIVMGVALLASFALLGLVDLGLLFYLGIFFVITYFVIGSLMAAIGAAVNEVKEAQSMFTPLMIVLMMPMMLQVPISQNPNSAFSTAMSFVPPINTFAMLMRMASTSPPPLWQVWLSIGVGVASAFAAVWFAAKVFKIGLLMYGKPPDFATLVRWVRAS